MAAAEIKSLFQFLLSPWAILTGITAGVLIGLYQPSLAPKLAPAGEMYLSLLQMCVLPIMMTAIISSIAPLFAEHEAKQVLYQMILVFGTAIISVTLIGLMFGYIGGPGSNLEHEAKITLSKILVSVETSQGEDPDQAGSLVRFFVDMIPKNVFSAISLGKPVPVLFFSILFGMALGSVWHQARKTALTVIAAFNGALFKIIEWIMYGLPFGLCCLLAEQIARVGPDIIHALFRYVIVFHLAAVTVFVVNTLLIKIISKKSLFHSITYLKEPLIVAMGTTSSFASIPSALRALEDSFQLDKRIVNLIVPVGINMNPQGMLIFATISTLFIAQLFNAHLTGQQYMIVIIGSIFMSMAASGAPGGAIVPMIAIVLEPLGLPVNAAVILLFAIITVVDPALTMVTVHANCTAAIILDNWQAQKGKCHADSQ